MDEYMKVRTNLIDKREELVNCTFAKAVLAVSIVFYHSIVFWRGNWVAAIGTPMEKPMGLYWLTQWLASFQNYAFVLTAGYLFCYVKYERRGYNNYVSFIVNKAKRLLVPFLFVGAIWVIPISCLYLKQDFKQVLLDYLLVQDAGQLWFVVMLFGVFILFWPLSDFCFKNHLAGLGVMLAIYAFRFVGWGYIPGYFSIWNVAKYMIIFWLGFKLRQGTLDFLRKIPLWIWLAVYTFLVICLECVVLPHGTLNKLFHYGVEFAVHSEGAVMAFFLLQKLAQQVQWKNSKIIHFFTKRSMVIYLFHQQVIYFVVKELNGKLNPYIHAGLNFVIAMVISSAIAVVFMKFSVTRNLVGEK